MSTREKLLDKEFRQTKMKINGHKAPIMLLVGILIPSLSLLSTSTHPCGPLIGGGRTLATRRLVAPLMSEENTDWEEAMAALRKRQQEVVAEPPEAAAADAPNLVSETPPVRGSARFEPPPTEGGGFRFASSRDRDAFGDRNTVSGSSENDERLRLLTLIGGRALTAITLSSLVFFIYIGLSGGITDGFDRFDEPIEDIRVTMQENARLEAEAEARAAERVAAERAAAERAAQRAENIRLGFYDY